MRKEHQVDFDDGPSLLARYATRFNAVEINSSFYRPHRATTYARWAASVPDHFRFAVKVPRTITHEKRLNEAGPELERFMQECTALGTKLGPLLIQLPPSLAFDQRTAWEFMKELRQLHQGDAVLEARHASWFSGEADALLLALRVPRVIADPAAGGKATPTAESNYWRLHGSPRIYYSDYSRKKIHLYAEQMARAARSQNPVWCIFDNTALGHAVPNALELLSHLDVNRASTA